MPHRLLGAALALLVFAAGDAMAPPALAQEDHLWIQNNELYKRADGLHCCGKEHCEPLPHEAVVETAQGWRVLSTGQVFAEGAPGLYRSRDWQPWGCWDKTKKLYDCLFVQPGGV
jgi:hypothetical protein